MNMKFYKNKKILIAGGSGLVGTNLFLELIKFNKKITASYYKSKPKNKFKKYYKKFNFLNFKDCIKATKNKDIVFILAVKQSGILNLKKNYENYINNNFLIRSNLLRSCKINKVKKIIWVSSSTIYQPYKKKISENSLNLNIDPYDIYYGTGWLYRYLEKLFLFFKKNNKIDVRIIRTSAIYGPHDNFNDKTSHVIPSLIKKCFKKGRYLKVLGKPDVTRDFVFVKDLINAIIMIAQKKTATTPINFSYGKACTIKELAKIILDKSNQKKKIKFIKNNKSSADYRVLNNKKFDHNFPYFTRTPLKKGIYETINWYKSSKKRSN